MYHLNNYERALRTFGIQVEIICAMELGGSITPEQAHQRLGIVTGKHIPL